MKSLLVIFLLTLATPKASGFLDGSTETKLFSEHQQEDWLFNVIGDGRNHLLDFVKSVDQRGIWFYYEKENFNETPGKMYLISGDSVTADLPTDFPHIIGSLRPAQQFLAFGQDIINVYEKGTFTGKSDYSKEDLPKFKIGEAASLVITSYNPWTVYTGEYYTGDSLCVTPYTDLNLTSNPPVPMVGYYPYISKMGVPITIKSARHGCYSDDVVQPAPVIKLDGRTEAGGWGPIV